MSKYRNKQNIPTESEEFLAGQNSKISAIKLRVTEILEQGLSTEERNMEIRKALIKEQIKHD